MALPSIGSHEFKGWPDRITPRTRGYRIATRPALDGSTVIWDAWRTSPQTITTVSQAADRPAAQALAASYRALINTFVTVVDPMGTINEHVLIIDAVPQPSQSPDGSNTITTRWTILLDASVEATA